MNSNPAPAQANYDGSDKGSNARNMSGEADGVRYTISHRDVNSIVTCQLQPNASINLTAGVMAGRDVRQS